LLSEAYFTLERKKIKSKNAIDEKRKTKKLKNKTDNVADQNDPSIRQVGIILEHRPRKDALTIKKKSFSPVARIERGSVRISMI